MKFYIYLILFISISSLMLACSSGPDEVEDICKKLEEASNMTDDCDKMADQLASGLSRLSEQMRVVSQEMSPEIQREYVEALSGCMSSILEIKTGNCKKHEGVNQALEKLKERSK